MKHIITALWALCFCCLLLCSCKDEDNGNYNESGSITTSENTNGGLSGEYNEAEVTAAKKPSPEYDFEYTLENEKIKITGYKGSDSDVVIPSEILGKPVTNVEKSFLSGTSVTELTLPESMTEFSGLSKAEALETINLPSSLETFGGSMINMPSLKNMNI